MTTSSDKKQRLQIPWLLRRFASQVLALAGLLYLASVNGMAAPSQSAEFFFILPGPGEWQGELRLTNPAVGAISKIVLYSGEAGGKEVLVGDSLQRINRSAYRWKANVRERIKGLHVYANVTDQTTVILTANKHSVAIPWPEFPAATERVLQEEGRDLPWLVYRRGNPETGPKAPPKLPLPELFSSPHPGDAVRLPDAWATIGISLDQAPLHEIDVRRAAKGDGLLYLQVYSPEGPLTGKAQVFSGGREVGEKAVDGSLWLSLQPRIGRIGIEIRWPGQKEPLRIQAPTTLIETVGPQLRVNGEPYLVKGVVAYGVNDQDAKLFREMSGNTLRGGNSVAFAEKYGFLAVAACQRGPTTIVERKSSPTEEEFNRQRALYIERMLPVALQAARSPNTLSVQVGNEQTSGPEPWGKRLGVIRPFERLDLLLTEIYNAVRPVDLMVPLNYANNAFGYRTPEFYPVYTHNTYLDKDRDWPVLERFMELQGADRRPYFNTEFGANNYMPQPYLGAPNHPILEKIHAWNLPNRWETYLKAESNGGVIYCMHDYEPGSRMTTNSTDNGFTNFGILTWDGKPKLAVWSVRQMYRDFDVVPQDSGKLVLKYKRHYAARKPVLTIEDENGIPRRYPLTDIAPLAETTVETGSQPSTFRWRLDYQTHGGLETAAAGIWPLEADKKAFLRSLEGRETYNLLSRFFDAEVLSFEGAPAPITLKELEDKNGTIRVAFRCTNGDVYLSAFSRKPVNDGLYHEGVALVTKFEGKAELVDDLTGEPLGQPLDIETIPGGGMKIKGLRVPYIAARFGQRPREAVSFPLIRIRQVDSHNP